MLKTAFITTLLLLSFNAQADDPSQMLNDDCTSCHQSNVYTRKDRKVKSLKDLSGQVSRCVSATGANWFPDDQKAVINLLNKKYYKFSPQ